MPATTPMPTKNPGDVLTSALWNSYLRDNIDKLLTRGHRVLTVAQFAALSSPEGTKGTVAPDEVYLEVDSTNGIQWQLAYESGEPTYKWRFLGGPPMTAFIASDESTTTTGAWADVTTAGPFVTVARGGDYAVAGVAGMYTTAAAATLLSLGIAKGATNPSAPQIIAASEPVTLYTMGLSLTPTVITAVAAGENLRLRYMSGAAGTMHAVNRSVAVTPVRLV